MNLTFIATNTFNIHFLQCKSIDCVLFICIFIFIWDIYFVFSFPIHIVSDIYFALFRISEAQILSYCQFDKNQSV